MRGIPPLARQQRQLITAMSAIDIALWDLMGKATERPVYALLGGALRQRLPAYVTGFYYRDNERLMIWHAKRHFIWRKAIAP